MDGATATRLAAVSGFLAVGLGAFGAHGLSGHLAARGTAAAWGTAVLYHLAHSAVLLALAGRNPVPGRAFGLFLAGIAVFSGSLYCLAATGPRWMGAVTPIGGLLLLAGWLALALAVGRRKAN